MMEHKGHIIILYCDIDTLSQEQLSHIEEQVSAERKARILPSMSDSKRLQHLVAGYLLERGLHLLGYPATFHYKKYDSGKPYIEFEDGRWAPKFSISHSGSKVACAISSGEVGIDVEDKSYEALTAEKKDRLPRMAARFFLPKEREYLQAHPQEFYQIWTFKEALTKAYNEPIMDVLQHYNYCNVLEKIQDVDMSQVEVLEDHIFLVKTSIQVEDECNSTIYSGNTFTSTTPNSGFYRLINAEFVGFLVDKG